VTTATPTPAAGLALGEARRDVALEQLRDCRPMLIRRVQRTYLVLLLDRGPSTIDPVRALVPLPTEIDPRLVGAAVRQFAALLLIHRAGLSRSVRPQAHGRDLPMWAVADRAAAVAWIASHPELPEPAAEDLAPRQLTVF
jgi:hypothetical protein